jgi:hypothetical protein
MSGVTVATMIASRSLAANAALGERFLRRFGRQIAGRNAFVDEMAFADADAAHDPFVVGIDHFSRSALVRRRGGT